MFTDFDLTAINVADLSDEEAVALATLIEAQEQLERWQEIAATFPEVDRDTWPIDYGPVLRWREETIARVTAEGLKPANIKYWYRHRPREFIEHWGTTYDPRNAGTSKPTKMPMLLFKRQTEFIDWLLACVDSTTHGLAEKVRDFGLSWLAVFVSVWMWTTWSEAPAIGFGSQKEELVDVRGDPKTLFEKIRIAIRYLPWFLLPEGFAERSHLTERNCVNPETGATIIGEIGDNIGRGGRTLLYFKDEASHYQHPDMIEAALGDNTNVQIDISTPNGLGNVFHRRRKSGEVWIPGATLPGRRRASVFIADWRDHPGKDQTWYDERRAKAEAEGLLHKFKQEVDRDYAASVEGVIIPAEWVQSAIDAHIVLGIPDDGPWCGALDVADGGGDTNADAWFKGIVLRNVESWTARDTGETTHRFLEHAEGRGHVELQYDAIGVGAGVKAEANRLADEGVLSPYVRLVPWVASAAPLDPDAPVVPDDRDSPSNRDFYENLKSQAWWRTRLRFEKTHRAVLAARGGQPFSYEPHELISIDGRIPLIRQIEDELSQPTQKLGTRRLVINKTPEGTKSPNLADAIIMAANPTSGLKPIITVAKNQFEIPPFKLPSHFKKGFAMMVRGQRVECLWGAYDQDADLLYLTTEYVRDYAEPGIHAQAIVARGKWIPGIFDCEATNLKHFDELMRLYHGHGIPNLSAADRAVEAGIGELQQRISTGRLKVFSTCTNFFTDYRNFRRDDDGKIVGGGLMDCARHLARAENLRRMAVEPSPYAGVQATGNLYR